jgi:hypothetical protein
VTDPFAGIPPFTDAETVLPGCWAVTGRRVVVADRRDPVPCGLQDPAALGDRTQIAPNQPAKADTLSVSASRVGMHPDFKAPQPHHPTNLQPVRHTL